MADCSIMEECNYLKRHMRNMPRVVKTIKSMYCHWHYEECARYKIGIELGVGQIPADLFPTETETVDIILSQFPEKV